MAAIDPSPQPVEKSFLAKHPERLVLLGGVWVAMVTLGGFGFATLVDPTLRMPLVDPLLEYLAEREARQALPPAASGEKVTEPQSEVQPPAPTAMPQETAAETTPAPAPATPSANTTATAPQAPPASTGYQIPIWLCVVIIVSCATGSLVITAILYKASVQARKRRQKLMQVQQQRQRIKGKGQRRTVITPQSGSEKPIQKRTPATEPIPAIAPLQISTPEVKELPHLHIEPVVDPQPTQQIPTRAAQLASLVQQAKQQHPKGLVEMMDIRRRNRVAQF